MHAEVLLMKVSFTVSEKGLETAPGISALMKYCRCDRKQLVHLTSVLV